MILNIDREKGHIRLSTKKLEPNTGDMICNPGLVFEKVFSLLAGVIFSCHLYGCLFLFLLLPNKYIYCVSDTMFLLR